MLELKKSFVKAIDQQAPAIQQFEKNNGQFCKHSAPSQNSEFLLRMSASCFNTGL